MHRKFSGDGASREIRRKIAESQQKQEILMEKLTKLAGNQIIQANRAKIRQK